MILIALKDIGFYLQAKINSGKKELEIKAKYQDQEFEDTFSIDPQNKTLEDFIIESYKLNLEEYKITKKFSSWLWSSLAGKIIDQKFIGDFEKIRNLLIEELQKKPVEALDILSITDKAIIYSPAEGMDVIIRGKTFRLHDDDFLSPKNFLIWYASVFGGISNLNIGKEEWKALVSEWIQMSEKASPGKDILAPPVLTELIEKIIDNRVENDFTRETLMDLENTQIFAFILKNNSLYVHSKIYNYLMQKYKVSPRKMRQYFEHYLLDDASKQIKLQGSRARFWRMDWNKMKLDFPELEQVKVIEIKEAEVVQVANELNLSYFEEIAKTIDIDALLKAIKELFGRVIKDNKIMDENLKGDIIHLLSTNRKEIDNDEYLRDILTRLLSLYKKVEK